MSIAYSHVILVINCQKLNSLLTVLSLAPLGTDTKTHTKLLFLRRLQKVFVCWCLCGFGGGGILMDITCAKVSLEFCNFQVGSHMIVAVGDPLADSLYWVCQYYHLHPDTIEFYVYFASIE